MKRRIAASIAAGIAAGCFTMFGILGLDVATTGWVQLDNIRLPDWSTEVVIYREISHLYKVDCNFIVLSNGEESFLDWVGRTNLSPVPEDQISDFGVTRYSPHEKLSEFWIDDDVFSESEHYHGEYRNHSISALYHDGKVYIEALRIWR